MAFSPAVHWTILSADNRGTLPSVSAETWFLRIVYPRRAYAIPVASIHMSSSPNGLRTTRGMEDQ